MAKQRQRLIEVPFSKTECGVDFFINTAHGRERPGVLTEYEAFKTDFFEIFFIRKANGYVPAEIEKGYVLVCYQGFPLGFVKHLGNRANNLYPQEWRIRTGYMPEQIQLLTD